MRVLERIRKALGRPDTTTAPPRAPSPPEPLLRLVHTAIGLPELFAQRAIANGMQVELLAVDELADRLLVFLKENGLQRVGIGGAKLFCRLGLHEAIAAGGHQVCLEPDLSLEMTYQLDAGITDTWAAVAETGALAIRSAAGLGRSLSLMPPVHIAIVEPKNLVPDLIDLAEKIERERVGGTVTLVAGPSKTADIEMNIVVGVHGPWIVKVFCLK